MRPFQTIVVAMLLLAPSAAADPGVNVDPDTPAGKEYALPLDEARKEATGESGGDVAPPGQQPPPAPLFGAGVERAKADRAKAEPGDSRGTPENEPDSARTAAVGVAVDPDGGSPERTVGLAALGLLALGGIAGLLLRRGLNRS